MGEKTQKWLVIAGLVIVCIGLAFGISRVLYREPVAAAGTADLETGTEETELVLETGDMPEDGMKIQQKENGTATEAWTASGTMKQEIQPEPEKTEEEKPEEAPRLPESADVEDPTGPPAYEETEGDAQEGSTGQAAAAASTPSQGATQNGMIYIEGFGWIPDNGGGGSGTVAGDMYENGNKVGIMD